ncbi:MAG: FkbM family methyltransferase [Deltaproteobacteria bacterium]|nr:FkbM family methyltransferase [Deltaproteobacteria bacterium]
MTIVDTWVFNQYKIEQKVEPVSGDIVIDGGSFYGETALWFSKHVGDNGKVYAFEPLPENISILKDNIERNHISNIEVVDEALYDKIGRFKMRGIGPIATLVNNTEGIGPIPVITLDHFVKREDLDKVNFIKMDIEGSEMPALRGSAETIQRFKPKLAISIYHLKDDLIKIPGFIKGLVPDYKMYLKHSTPGINETVLFASL